MCWVKALVRWLKGLAFCLFAVLSVWLFLLEYKFSKEREHYEAAREFHEVVLEEKKHHRYVRCPNGTVRFAWSRPAPRGGILYPDGAIYLQLRSEGANYSEIHFRFQSVGWVYPDSWRGKKPIGLPDGSWQMPDGAIILSDGTLKDTPEAYVPYERGEEDWRREEIEKWEKEELKKKIVD